MNKVRELIMRLLIAAICVLGFHLIGKSQLNNGINFNPHFSTVSSNAFPSKIGEGYNKVEVVFPHLRAWLGNNALNYDRVNTLLSSGSLSDDFIAETIADLKDENNIGTGLELQLLKVNVNIRNKEQKHLFSFSLGATEQLSANLNFNKNLFKLIYEGNKQFAGETVALGPAGMNALYYRNLALGVGVPIAIPSEKLKITIQPAARFRYLMGVASVYTKEGNITMYTEPSGQSIDFNFNYDLNTAIPSAISQFAGGTGSGFAADAGVAIHINDFISAHLAVDDIGSIAFKEEVDNYRRTGNYTYDGLEVNVLSMETNAPVELDSLMLIFDPDRTNEAYKMPLDKKLAFQTEVRLGQKATKKKGLPYYSHHLFLAYLQGFDNYLASSTNPVIGLGYTYSLKNVLNIGSSLTVGGHNKIAFGPHVSVKAGFFKFGLSSNNITPFIAKKAGSGIDFDLSMALSF